MPTHYVLLVPHPHADQILVIPTANGVALPTVTQNDGCFWQCVDHVNALALNRFGLTVRTRRCLSVEYDDASDTQTKGYLLELLALPPALPPDTHWLACADALAQLPATERDLVAAWLDWQRTTDQRRVAWYEPDWMPPVEAWLRQQLGPTVAVTQLRSWQRSAMVHASVGEQSCYFKAVPSLFAHEIALSLWLAEHVPNVVPAVQAVQIDQGWLLLREVGGVALDAQPDLERWALSLRRYAKVQVATVPHTAALLRMGLPDRSGRWLDENLDQLLADPAALLVDQPSGLSSTELAQLHEHARELHQRCAELQACGMPAALEHGDFGPWQVLVDAERITFLDWSDAAVANPLFSLASFLLSLPEPLHTPEAHKHLVAAYLAPWEAVVPPHTLRQAWSHSQALVGLYAALIYQREVLPQMEVRWEMERMLPYFARQLLRT